MIFLNIFYHLHGKDTHCVEDRHKVGSCNADLPCCSNSFDCWNHLWAQLRGEQAPHAMSSWALTSILPATLMYITLKYFCAEQPLPLKVAWVLGRVLLCQQALERAHAQHCWYSNNFVSDCSRYYKTLCMLHRADIYDREQETKALCWEYQHTSPQLLK